MSISPPSTILVIRGGALGDFILTLPVLAALRRAFPSASVEILGYPRIASLAVAGGLAEAAHSIESPRLNGLFVPGGALDDFQRAFFSRYQWIVSYLYDPDGGCERKIRQCGTERFLQGRHRPRDEDAIHATSVFLQALEPLGLGDLDPRPALDLQTAGARRAFSGQGLIAAHPGSGSPRKNWPEDRWIDLMTRSSEQFDTPWLLVGGEAEEGTLERIASRLPSNRVELAKNLPLPELAARLLVCRAFLGHDSGVTHLAAALNRHGLALWGPSSETVWRPLSPRIRLVKAGAELSALSVGHVESELRSLLESIDSTPEELSANEEQRP